jgi:NAD(P)-dependent dehydrogenase (short-subunit alcohol dehydrogenase family)
MLLLVTGANRGIGLELTRTALARGDQVIAAVREPEAAAELKAIARPTLSVRRCDVASEESIKSFAAGLGAVVVDVLINNAGVYGGHGSLESLDPADVVATFRINALGPLLMTRAVLPMLRKSKIKKVVHISSMMGSIGDNGSGGFYAYRMSKAALNMLARNLSRDLAGEGIISVAMNPGWVRTDMGGPSAPTSAQECAAGILREIDRLTPEHSGRFLDYRGGADRPW